MLAYQFDELSIFMPDSVNLLPPPINMPAVQMVQTLLEISTLFRDSLPAPTSILKDAPGEGNYLQIPGLRF